MNDKKLTNEAMNIKPHRLSKQEIEDNFTDLHPPLSAIEALIEADRCYFFIIHIFLRKKIFDHLVRL